MTHANRGEPRCTGVWPVSGRPCKHRPLPGTDTCAAHDPAGDRRPPPPADEHRCAATSQETGERCRLRHPPGGTVCTCYHGGAAKQVRAKTKARDDERRLREMVVTYGLPIDITPEQAMLDEVHRAAGIVAWLETQIRELSPHDVIWGVTRIKEGGDDRGTTREAVPHVLIRLFQQERALLAKVAADAIRVGIEERQVKFVESQGAAVVKALRAILTDLQLTAAQKALVADVVPRRLREVALTN